MDETKVAPQLTISPVAGATYLPFSIPLCIEFRNRSAAPIRILNQFEPTPVFFSFDIVATDGTPVLVAGGGKIDFGPTAPSYLELSKDDAYSFEVDLGTLLSAPLQRGRYLISSTYHNQYGDNCFRGVVKSNTIPIEIRDGSERNL